MGEERIMKNLREVCKEFATKNRINYSENSLDQCGVMVGEWLKQHIPGHENDIYPTPEDALQALIYHTKEAAFAQIKELDARLIEANNENAGLRQQLYRRTIERDEAAARAEKAEEASEALDEERRQIAEERDELKKEVARLDEENNEITDLKSRLSRQVQANQDLVEVNCSLIKERDEANQKVAKYSAAMTDWRQETGGKFNELGLVLKARDEEIAQLKSVNAAKGEVIEISNRNWHEQKAKIEELTKERDEAREERDAANARNNGHIKPSPESNINHPKHYNQHPSGIECIDVVEHFNFNLGNTVKYVWRCGLKEDEIEDLRKANWYIEREIQKREKAKLSRQVQANQDLVEVNCSLIKERDELKEELSTTIHQRDDFKRGNDPE